MSRGGIDPELVRRAADHELSAGEGVPAGAARAVSFERELRARVSEVMRDVPPAGDLRTSVLLHVVRRLEEERESRRSPGRRRSLVRGAALATMLLVGVGIGRFTNVAATFGPPPRLDEEAEESGLAAGLDDFLRERFFEVGDKSPLSQRQLLGECENALAATTAWLGSLPLLACPEERGVRLVGTGPCPHPGVGRGSLMVYEVEVERGRERVMVFVQALWANPPKQEEGRVVALEGGERQRLTWVQDGLAYHVVSESLEAAERLIAAMGLEPSLSRVPEIPGRFGPK